MRRLPIQNGKGIGSIFRAISRFIFPVAKKIISSPIVKQNVKKIGKQALETGVGSLADSFSGKDPSERIKHDIKKIGTVVGKSALNTVLNSSEGSAKRGKKRLSKVPNRTKRKKVKRTSIYDRQ